MALGPAEAGHYQHGSGRLKPTGVRRGKDGDAAKAAIYDGRPALTTGVTVAATAGTARPLERILRAPRGATAGCRTGQYSTRSLTLGLVLDRIDRCRIPTMEVMAIACL